MWGRVEHYSVKQSSDIWRATIWKKNIFIFQIAFSQWRAGLWKKLFWDVFLRLASFIFMKNFSFHSPALHVFCQKITYFLSYLWGKYFSCKMFTVLHQSKFFIRFGSKLSKNWAITFKKISTLNCNGGLHSAMVYQS